MTARYTITFRPAAVRQLRKIPRDARERLEIAIELLAENPRPPRAQSLRGTPGWLRLRVGDYRIVYEVRDTEFVGLVITVGHRREVYRGL